MQTTIYYQQPPPPLYQPFQVGKIENPALVAPVEYLNFYPTCFNIVTMLPFPFFCAGCYCSVTARLEFHHNTRTLVYKGCRGFCFPCGQTLEIPYDKVGSVSSTTDRTVKVDKKPSFVVTLSTEYRSLPITGNVSSSEASQAQNRLTRYIDKIKLFR